MEILKIASESSPPLVFKETQAKWKALIPFPLQTTVAKIAYSSAVTGQSQADYYLTQVTKEEFEAVVFNQILLANVIKNLIVSQFDVTTMDSVFKAMSEMAVELATFLDNKNINITSKHIRDFTWRK